MTGTLQGVSNKHCLLSFFSFYHQNWKSTLLSVKVMKDAFKRSSVAYFWAQKSVLY